MAFDDRTFKRLARTALIGFALVTAVAPVPAAPLQYQSDRNGSTSNAYPGERNPCDPLPGQRHVEEQGSADYCNDQPKYVLHGSDAPRRPGSSAFGLQFDTEGY
jgi:hypothetical protein